MSLARRLLASCVVVTLLGAPAALAAADPVACAAGQVSAPALAAMAGEPGAGALGQVEGGLRVLDVLAAKPAPADSLPLDAIAAACGLQRDAVADALIARGLAFRAVEDAATAQLTGQGAPADAVTRALSRMSQAYRTEVSVRLARAGAYDVTRYEDRAIADGVRRARVVSKPGQLPHLVRAMLSRLAQQGVSACLAAPSQARAACAGLAD